MEALEKKEQGLSENERKKLGSLALRLTERLQGPALQIARTIGITRLAESDGTATLLKGLEDDLLPLRRQAAVELCQAGSAHGPMSRHQYGEPMSSYCLRREAWWVQLRELDDQVQCSRAILGEQMLTQAGIGSMETQLVRSVMQNDLSDHKKLAQTLRDQFGSVHEKERSKGRGKDGSGKGWNSWSRNNYGYMADASTTSGTSVAEETYSSVGGSLNEESLYEHEDWTEDPEWLEETESYYDAGDELQIEEDVICWFVEQGVHPQTCSTEDLESGDDL